MSWFKYGILSGKIAAKKAETLTNDWVELSPLTETANKREYKHQGLEKGLYLVNLKESNSWVDCFFLIHTGHSAREMNNTNVVLNLTTNTIRYSREGDYRTFMWAKVKRIF